MGQESCLEELCDNMLIYSAGDGGNEILEQWRHVTDVIIRLPQAAA